MVRLGKVGLVVAVFAVGFVSGCSGDDISGSCSLCENGVPVGPSANDEACQSWGDESGCAEAVLINAGMCGEVSATCTVADCAMPVGQCILIANGSVDPGE